MAGAEEQPTGGEWPRDLDADGLLAGSGDLLGELERWAADARVHEAARQRARETWLRRQAGDEANLAGTLTDLAERGTAVSVATRSGRRQRGRIRAIGADFCALRSETGQDVLIALTALVSIRTLPDVPPLVGDRTLGLSLQLVDVLIGLSADRPRVLVTTTTDETVTGTLWSVGTDLVTVRGDGRPPAYSYVPADAISEVALT